MTEQLPLLVRDGQRSQLQTQALPVSSSAGKRAAAAARSLRKRKWLGRASVSFAIALLATVALMAAVSWPPSSGKHMAKSTELETIMERYRARNFSGVVRLSHNGEHKFSDWMGLANEEFVVPIEKHSIFPIGSNSKLFTSVAMHQLQERGRVNLSQAVNAYLDAADFASFGFANQTHWCPRVAGGNNDAPCENITFVQLLTMGSGMGDGSLCDNAMAPYCPGTPANDLAHYKGSIAKHVGAFINAPLAFRPGTHYSYSDTNYVLLSYLIEKLSGQKFETYLSEQIFDKIGLKHTYYDPYAGGRLVHRGFVSQYANFYAQLAEQPGSKMVTAAIVNNGEELETREFLATGTCGPSVNSGALSGAGGIHSTAKDMHRVYKDLFLHRGQQSKVLSEHSIRSLLLTRNPVRNEYAQGIVVAFDSDDEDAQKNNEWPSKISYCGRLKCVVTCMAMQTLGNDSVVASAFTNHVEYTFLTSDAFAQWQPTDDSYLPSVLTNINNSNNSAVGSFQVGDYHVAELSWALLDVFLGYFKATEGS